MDIIHLRRCECSAITRAYSSKLMQQIMPVITRLACPVLLSPTAKLSASERAILVRDMLEAGAWRQSAGEHATAINFWPCTSCSACANKLSFIRLNIYSGPTS